MHSSHPGLTKLQAQVVPKVPLYYFQTQFLAITLAVETQNHSRELTVYHAQCLTFAVTTTLVGQAEMPSWPILTFFPDAQIPSDKGTHN